MDLLVIEEGEGGRSSYAAIEFARWHNKIEIGVPDISGYTTVDILSPGEHCGGCN